MSAQNPGISALEMLTPLEAIDAVGEDLARRRIERDRDPVAMTRALGGLEDQVDRRLARRRGSARSRPRRRRAVERPRSVQQLLQPVVDLDADSQPAEKDIRAAGTTMNSWRSIELSACAPPLITFIIGTGSVVASSPPRQRKSGRLRPQPPLWPRRARRRGSRSRRAVPCSASRRARSARGPVLVLVAWTSSPRTASRDLAVRVARRRCETPLPFQRSPPSRSSTASCTPVDAPDGTIARPSAPARAHLDLDGRIPAGVEDLAGADLGDSAHSVLLGPVEVARPARQAEARSNSLPSPRRAPRQPPRAPRKRCAARRSSSSGSTSSRRATFTAAKRTSPSSSPRRLLLELAQLVGEIGERAGEIRVLEADGLARAAGSCARRGAPAALPRRHERCPRAPLARV